MKGWLVNAEIVDRQVVYNRWSRVSEVLLRMPNGAIEKRIIEDHGGAAAVLLYDPERCTALLLRQPRAPVIDAGEQDLLEVVAGRLEGKSAEATARAEAWEEAGVRVQSLEHVASVWTMPAVSTERLDLYLAAYSLEDRIGVGGGAETENEAIVVEEIALATLRQMVLEGALADGKTFTLTQALMLHRPDLFTWIGKHAWTAAMRRSGDLPHLIFLSKANADPHKGAGIFRKGRRRRHLRCGTLPRSEG